MQSLKKNLRKTVSVKVLGCEQETILFIQKYSKCTCCCPFLWSLSSEEVLNVVECSVDTDGTFLLAWIVVVDITVDVAVLVLVEVVEVVVVEEVIVVVVVEPIVEEETVVIVVRVVVGFNISCW